MEMPERSRPSASASFSSGAGGRHSYGASLAADSSSQPPLSLPQTTVENPSVAADQLAEVFNFHFFYFKIKKN
jgi:hypothetical protein